MKVCEYEKRIYCPAFLLGIVRGDVCPDCGAETDAAYAEQDTNAHQEPNADE